MKIPRWFEVLLRSLPPEFRESHEKAIGRLLASYTRDFGVGRRWLMWLRAAGDVVVVATGLWARRGRRTIGRVMSPERLTKDVRFAARALLRRPGFTAIAITTLGVGIGANTALYSVVNGVLLKPLPYAQAERIGILWHRFGFGAQDLPAVHPLDARDYRARSELLSDLTMAAGREWILGGVEDPELVDAGVVEAGFFEFFGVTPRVGRTFSAVDDEPGAAPTVLLSNRLWERRFGGDPSVVGRSIEVSGESMRVIGVLPESFRLHLPPEAFRLRDPELWAPLRLDPGDQPPRNFTGYTVFVRLAPGVSFPQAQQELEVMSERLRSEHPEHAASNLEARVVPLHQDVVKRAESMLLFLLGATGFVLLIACANVTNLVVVRGQGRSREFALRSALGAGRGAILRLSLVEGALLSIAGAVVGLLLSTAIVGGLRRAATSSVPMLESVGFDVRVLAFATGAALLSVCVVGLVPAIRSTTDRHGPGIAGGGGTVGSRDQRRFRNVLVVGEVAASLLLLVGTGLMIRSFNELGSVDPGFELENTLTMRISFPSGAFRSGEERDVVREQLFDEVRGFPGVRSVAAINQLPLTGSGALQPFAYDEETASAWESATADERSVSIDFFEAIGARWVEGGGFTASDMRGADVIVIDDRLATLAFPNGDAIGGRLQVRPNDVPEHQRFARVVGVVEHLRLHELSRPHLTQIWTPMRGSGRFSLVVKTVGEAGSHGPRIRATVQRLAPGSAVEDVRTLEELASTSLAPVRFTLTLMGAFGFVALVLASVGLYGVLSFTISQRTNEIAVRMALGQSPGQIRRLVLRDGGRLVVVALVLGLVVAGALARLAAGLVYGVGVFDPLTYLGTALVLGFASALACWAPARRATRIQPAAALRETG